MIEIEHFCLVVPEITELPFGIHYENNAISSDF